MPPQMLLLLAITTTAFVVEASLGFGATVVAVTLGALAVPLDQLLPSFVPLNLALSIYLVARAPRSVDVRLLVRRVVPLMALGMPIGMWAFRALPSSVLTACFGGFVVALAALELLRRGPPGPLPRSVGAALLALGGMIHGAFGTGGPMAVYVVGRELDDDKRRFRATLSGLWFALNLVLVAGYVADGRMDRAALVRSAYMAAGLALGVGIGEALHARIPAARFRVAVYALLLVAGVVLVVRAV